MIPARKKRNKHHLTRSFLVWRAETFLQQKQYNQIKVLIENVEGCYKMVCYCLLHCLNVKRKLFYPQKYQAISNQGFILKYIFTTLPCIFFYDLNNIYFLCPIHVVKSILFRLRIRIIYSTVFLLFDSSVVNLCFLFFCKKVRIQAIKRILDFMSLIDFQDHQIILFN